MPKAVLMVGDDAFAANLIAAIGSLGFDVQQCSSAEEIPADGALDVAVVRNPAGVQGLSESFFAVRSIIVTARSVVVLDVGHDEVDSGSLATLADGLVKAYPRIRLALLSDRIEERIRPTRTRAASGRAPDAGAVAQAVAALASDSSWSSGHRQHLSGGQRIR